MREPDPSALRYGRGFLASADRPTVERAVPTGWVVERFGGYHIARCPLVRFSASTGPRRSVAALGFVMDVDDPFASPDVTVERLVAAPDIQTALDRLGGRYVVFVEEDGDLRLQGDAAGTRSIVHTMSAPTVAGSHERMVGHAIGAPASGFDRAWMGRNRVAHLPGRTTPFAGVVHLIPKTEVSLATGAVRRIYPRSSARHRSVEEVTELVEPLLRGQVDALR